MENKSKQSKKKIKTTTKPKGKKHIETPSKLLLLMYGK